MCPDMDTHCVQTVHTSKRQRNWAPLQTAVGHWSAHGPFILNDSLSHDGFALLFHLHGSTVTDFMHKSSCSLTHCPAVVGHHPYACTISMRSSPLQTTLHSPSLVTEDSSRTNPFLGLWFQLLSTFAWCSCACQRLLRSCTWSRFHNASQSVPSKVRCTTHITYSFRIVTSFGFVVLLSTVQELRNLINLVPELCFSSRRRSTSFLVHTIHFIVLHQIVFISILTTNPALHVSDALVSVLQNN